MEVLCIRLGSVERPSLADHQTLTRATCGMTGSFERRDSGVYFQPFSNPRGTTRESPYRLYGRSSRG